MSSVMSLFRPVLISQCLYSVMSLFRHVLIPSCPHSVMSSFRHVLIPSFSLFRHCPYSVIVLIPSLSLFRRCPITSRPAPFSTLPTCRKPTFLLAAFATWSTRANYPRSPAPAATSSKGTSDSYHFVMSLFHPCRAVIPPLSCHYSIIVAPLFRHCRNVIKRPWFCYSIVPIFYLSVIVVPLRRYSLTSFPHYSDTKVLFRLDHWQVSSVLLRRLSRKRKQLRDETRVQAQVSRL